MANEENLPRIAWNNVLSTATITPSSEELNHLAVFSCDDTLYRSWQPESDGTHTIEASWTGLQEITCWCMYGHGLGLTAGSLGLEYWNGFAWALFGNGFIAPNGSECLYEMSEPIYTDRIRFVINSTPPSRIAALFVGNDLLCEEGLTPGWVDPTIGQKQKVVHATSRSGLALPSIIEDEFLTQRFTLKDVSMDWAMNKWLPFKQHCQTRPFFLWWNEQASPCYCSQATFENERYSRVGFVNVGFSARMVVQ